MLVPAHRIDAPACYVHHNDRGLAWPRIRAERAALAKWIEGYAGESTKPVEVLRREHRHPIDRYWSGETRFDLGALLPLPGTADSVTVRDYLGDATVFRLRPLGREIFEQVQRASSADTPRRLVDLGVTESAQLIGAAAFDRGQLVDAWAAACEYAVVGIDHWHTGDPPIGTRRLLDELHAVDPSLIAAIGQAAYLSSLPLRADELLTFA